MMDTRSEANLAHVHPDLVLVMREAAKDVSFIVIHGIRTVAEEAVNVAKGASQTMHSRHLPNKQGFACAVDIAAMVDGHVSWDAKPYSLIANAVKAEADRHAIQIEWGGDWKTLKDLGHFQLPWARYP